MQTELHFATHAMFRSAFKKSVESPLQSKHCAFVEQAQSDQSHHDMLENQIHKDINSKC